jgi:hypothetical protein
MLAVRCHVSCALLKAACHMKPYKCATISSLRGLPLLSVTTLRMALQGHTGPALILLLFVSSSLHSSSNWSLNSFLLRAVRFTHHGHLGGMPLLLCFCCWQFSGPHSHPDPVYSSRWPSNLVPVGYPPPPGDLPVVSL